MSMLAGNGLDRASQLNDDCFCVSVDRAKLEQAFERDEISFSNLMHERPHLYASVRVYVANAHLKFMAALVAAIERVVHRPQWEERVLSYAPPISLVKKKSAGVFLGYDFHLSVDGPKLIEINTNAGGGYLVTRMLEAQMGCEQPNGVQLPKVEGEADLETQFIQMFENEWRLEKGDAPLENIVIVDENPSAQFLSPEFELFRRLFLKHGYRANIAAPEELLCVNGQLSYKGQRVDLVYNRLTDFSLAGPNCAAIKEAYECGYVVLTPHPRAHALYADKRNLIALADSAWLESIGVAPSDIDLIQQGVPTTLLVTAQEADHFWSTRREWFFKPVAGYGSKGAYRGDKLTKRVFTEISQGGFVAQALVPPSERTLLINGEQRRLKVDLRNYVYQSHVQLVSARLYQGQTTNFRTTGGGFSAVFGV